MKYRLGDICTITKGATGIMKAIPGPYTMIALGEVDKTHNEYQFDARAVIIPLVSSTGHGHASMKRVKYFEGKFALGNILCAVIPNDESFVLAKYLHIYLHWNREELLVSQMKGMANVSLPMNRIADVMVTIPSIKKQIEIVELEKKLVEKEIEADKLFETQLTLIENLNQAILQEAVQGKLVPQDPKDEPAGELLKRIKAEKAKSGKKEKPLPPIKPEEIPFEIPGNWLWCKLGELALYSEAGKSYHAEGSQAQNDEWGVIKTSAITSGKFIEEENKRLPIQNENLEKIRIHKGDFIFCRASGSKGLAGKSCFVEFEPSCRLILSDKSIRYAFSDFVFSPYIQIYNSTCFASDYYRKLGTGKSTSMNNIVREDFNKLPIPLPPLSEQKRIVSEIEKQLAKTKQLKEHIIANRQATEQLLKALLHQAFEPGQEVNQEKQMQEI